MNLSAAILSDGFTRVARLAIQLPRDSRYLTKVDPTIAWGWPELFQMFPLYRQDH